jgi:hypothetical protein
MFRCTFLFLTFGFVSAVAPFTAQSQTMEDSPSLTFEAPFGQKDAGESEAMVNSTRDGSFNKVVTATPGWGLSVSAMGNLINVVEQGSNNTVVINASQTNTGSQQAVLATPLARSLDNTSAASSSGTSVTSAASQAAYLKN